MRFAYSIKQKLKIATLLFCVMACTILIRFLEDKSVKDMNESFVSMYKDRLIPATDLFYVAQNTYAKRSVLESALYTRLGKVSAESLNKQVQNFNTNIDSLIGKYEKTFLIEQEKQHLVELKKRLSHTAELDMDLLQLLRNQNFDSAGDLYENAGRVSSDRTIQKLSELMGIQTRVGEELIRDSAYMVSGSKLYSALQIALAIVIGILIVGIVFTSNVVKINNEKFNLN
jgi:hypothetical protein